jgi:hypothetical protein
MIEEVKAKGVKVVSIDHHEHEGKNVLKVPVFKRVREVLHKLTRRVPPFWQKLIFRFVPRVYHKPVEETDLEQGEVQTEIEVWAPGLGMEDPLNR